MNKESGYLLVTLIALTLCISTNARNIAGQELAQENRIPGLQNVAPKSGRFVKTDRGFMVPYEVTIPGSATKFTMQPIPGGMCTFEIPHPARVGDDSFTDKDDEPRTIQVEIEPFWMATHETTWGEFKHFMELSDKFRQFENLEMREVTDENKIDTVTAPSNLYEPVWRINRHGGSDEHAAGSMSQYSAKQYTKFISLSTGQFYRLPTAAQWQYACLAGIERKKLRVLIREMDENCWNRSNSKQIRHVPGKFRANVWGLFDMHGNVSEWVLDGGRFDESKWEKMQLTQDEAVSWPTGLLGRMAMGGGYGSQPEDCLHNSFRVSDEEWWEEDADFPVSPYWLCSEDSLDVGFRIIRPLKEPPTIQEKRKFWDCDCDELSKCVDGKIRDTGRGARGIVDKTLPAALKKLQQTKNR